MLAQEKTRLALQFARQYAEASNETCYCIHDNGELLFEDLKLHLEKPGDYFLLVDDANQLSGLRHVVDYVNKAKNGYRVKVLITVRNYALQKVRDDLSSIVDYCEINISKFSDQEIKTLMEEHYGIRNHKYLDRIVQIAEGNARVAMLAGAVAKNTNRLDSIHDVTQLYNDYYGSVFRDTSLGEKQPLQITAAIVAFLGVVQIDNIDPLISLLNCNGMNRDEFIADLNWLHQMEIVDIYQDKVARFSEQGLANYTLWYVFCDKRYIRLSAMIEACFGTFRKRVVQAVNTLFNLYQSEAVQEYLRDEIKQLWRKLQSENSPNFMEYVTAFYPVEPTETLLLLSQHIDDAVASSLPAAEIDTEARKNDHSIDDIIITILGGYADTDDLGAALDLFFQYYLKRPDQYMQFYHASCDFFGIHIRSIQFGFYTQIQYIKKITELSNSWDNEYLLLLFLDVSAYLLQLQFSPYESGFRGDSITIYTIPIRQSEHTHEYRTIIFEQLLRIAEEKKEPARLLGILKDYGNGLGDADKDVIHDDAPLLCQLASCVLSPDSVSHCLVAEHISKKVQTAGYPATSLDDLEHCSKLELYHLLKGPSWDSDMDIAELSKVKQQALKKRYFKEDDRFQLFFTMLDIYSELAMDNNGEIYEVAEGLNYVLQLFADQQSEYIEAIKLVTKHSVLIAINIDETVGNMFTMLSVEAVYTLLPSANAVHRNQLLYTFYKCLPLETIDAKRVEDLLLFLRDDSDRDIVRSAYRDIGFLNKYRSADENVVLEAFRIILQKKQYSAFIVSIYFGLLFNEYQNSPEDVIEKFARDIPLLEDIYLFMIEHHDNDDYRGSFLVAICNIDQSFLGRYVDMLMDKERYLHNDTGVKRCRGFYELDNYTEWLDSLIEEVMKYSQLLSFVLSKIIERLLSSSGGTSDCCAKQDDWIHHFIRSNCTDVFRMEAMFSALANLSMKSCKPYIEEFIAYNDDYEVFKALPLTPTSYGWSESALPLYSEWIGCLEELLPLFAGARFINHKKRVEDTIDGLRERMKQEELSEILRG